MDEEGAKSVKKKDKPSLGQFGVKASENDMPPIATEPMERTRAKGEKVGIVIRLNREDWHRLHDFANRQGLSIQRIVLTSLAQHMQAKGVKPISSE